MLFFVADPTCSSRQGHRMGIAAALSMSSFSTSNVSSHSNSTVPPKDIDRTCSLFGEYPRPYPTFSNGSRRGYSSNTKYTLFKADGGIWCFEVDKHKGLDHIAQSTREYLLKPIVQTRLQKTAVGLQKIFFSRTVLNQPPVPLTLQPSFLPLSDRCSHSGPLFPKR